ncbi:putative membrane protein YccC [Kitasatospora sp. MAA4]|uniref:FUSC family protein n=1 Tax=Kitasatospora sp. MAA4 TaxID=3035093 RepID=UPI0024730018|nr:FUSC family protein [Kitasatospora sp. MAA4]MDH6137942.1 putative membrane protein YccC [Kitasatospora sp. MAA4]
MVARHASELTPWQDRHRSAELHGLRGLAEQMRPALTAIADPRIGAPAEGPDLDRARELLAAAAEVLDALAHAIRVGDPLRLPRSASSLTLAPRTEDPMLHGPARLAAARLTTLLGRAVDTLDRTSPDTLSTPVVGSAGTLLRPSLFGMIPLVLRAVRGQFRPGSAVLRHAVRLATVVTVADLVGRLAGFRHGYWAPLTAAMVIRPDFAQTFSRGVARLAGTAAGVALATAAVQLLHPGEWLSAALAVTCSGPRPNRCPSRSERCRPSNWRRPAPRSDCSAGRACCWRPTSPGRTRNRSRGPRSSPPRSPTRPPSRPPRC